MVGKHILSIQSHVAYGYVGNRAAVFCLQRMGFDVIAVNTVQFSNHTGYGEWEGDVHEPAHLEAIMEGIFRRVSPSRICGILSGYLGSAALGGVVLRAVQRIMAENPQAKYVCDPVMGDEGRGFFVAPELPAFFTGSALSQAQIITPNMFEIRALTGGREDCPETSLADISHACRTLHETGPEYVLVTSVMTPEMPPDTIGMFLSCQGAGAPAGQYVIQTPRYDFPIPPNGAGDLCAALFAGHIISGVAPRQALELTAGAMRAVMEKTRALGQRELALIAAQNELGSRQYIDKSIKFLH